MWESPLLRLRRLSATEPVPAGEGDVRGAGEIRLDTTDTKDNKDFSVRVHSHWSSQHKSVSILNRSGGRRDPVHLQSG